MKYLPLLLIFLLSCSNKQKEYNYQDQDNDVYICTGSMSKKYHCDENCIGLKRCSGITRKVSVEEAQSMGRKECKFCYNSNEQ